MKTPIRHLWLLPMLSAIACLGGPATEDGTWGVGEDPGCDSAADHC